MKTQAVRVRFAPSPTGFMHLGNVRAALLNYIFAYHNNGTFVVRIEDTDAQRNFDPGAVRIQQDLAWLGLNYQEGPVVGGPYAPYYQSERTALYQEALESLKQQEKVYRCFCSSEELEKKRQRQIALKQPPRYDRTCYKLPCDTVESCLAQAKPFIWRFKVPNEGAIIITDIARGQVHFELKNFADFPLTRQDGSFTFIFANFVDDLRMQMTHVIRGEDHLTNTASQALLFNAFDAEIPLFWHLPIMCNTEGKKLSKRDFGFSLTDLHEGGFLPEAIVNYLGIIGGSFADEIMDVQELARAYNFDHIRASGQVYYDVEKLTWVNHQWIMRVPLERLVMHVKPFLQEVNPSVAACSNEQLALIVQAVRGELKTLRDIIPATLFYFNRPTITREQCAEHMTPDAFDAIKALVSQHYSLLDNPVEFLDTLKEKVRDNGLKAKDLFTFLRLTLSGTLKGPELKDIIKLLGSQESQLRLNI